MRLIDFNKAVSEKPIYISYFSTPECNVCKVLKPKVQELITYYKDAGFIYINVDKSKEIAGQLSVFTVPTIIVFVHGKETKRLSRTFSVVELSEYLDKLNEIFS